MKLKRRFAGSHSEDRPRWVWQLVWTDPCSGREASECVGYYCRARDNWRAPGGRLPRLSEKEANAARSRQLKQLADTRAGVVIPTSEATKTRWAEYCRQAGQPAGLAFERMLHLLTSTVFTRFSEICCRYGNRPEAVVLELLEDWNARQESDAPVSWDALTAWYLEAGSPNAGHRSRLEATTTFRRFAELCADLTERWQHLTVDDARVFHALLMKRYKPMTVRKHLTYMRALWNACKRTWVRGNPWAELRFPRSGADPEAWHCYTEKEINSLLEQADPVWKARIRLAWKSGLRPGEIDHLRLTDVDWDEGRVRIRGRGPTETTLEWTPKDKDTRTVPVDDETLGMLRKLQARGAPGNPYLFVSERRWRQALAVQTSGRWRISTDLVHGKRKRWLDIVAAAKLDADDGAPLVFYSLRKTCCCEMLIRGVPTHEVQALLGHSSVRTTLLWYSKVNKADAERRIRAAQSRAG